MAQFTINMAGVSAAFTLDDQDAGRILAAYTQVYTTTEQNEQGETVQVVPTPEQCIKKIAQSVIEGLANYTRRHEQDLAAQQAAAAVPPVSVVLTPA